MKYRIIRQHDQNDCGVACLLMIARFYGKEMLYHEVKFIVGSTVDGTSISELVLGAQKVGLVGEALKGTLSDLKDAIKSGEVIAPFIAHIKNENQMGHYVVVYKIDEQSVLVGNPAGKLEKQSLEQFAEVWTGYIIDLRPDDSFIQIKNCRKNCLLKSLVNYTQGLRGMLITVFLLGIIVAITNFVQSQVISVFIDAITGGGIQHDNFITNWLNEVILSGNLMVQKEKIIFGVIFFVMLQMGIMYINGYLMTNIHKRIDEKIIDSFYCKILKISTKYFRMIATGDFIARYNDIFQVKEMILMIYLDVSVSVITFVFSTIFLAIISTKLFGVILVAAVLYFALAIVYKEKIARNCEKTAQQEADVLSVLKETVEGIDTIKFSVSEDYFQDAFQEKVNRYLKLARRTSLIACSQECFNIGISGICNFAILGIGAYLCWNGQISVGTIVSFIYIMHYFLDPVSKIADYQSIYESGKIAFDRLEDILEAMEENGGERLSGEIGRILFNDVKFQYSNQEVILDNVNFSINAGEKVVIVGKSGSGKTSLAKLLVRSEELTSGNIIVGDTDLKDINLIHLRKSIAYLPQRSFVFTGTMRENIVLGRKNICERQLEVVCDICFENEYDNLESFLDSMIVENGANLSGGQIQRIALARAIICNPQIIIFDESTSNLDLYTEKRILNKIYGYLNNTTYVFVTHRLQDMDSYDKIIFVNGRTVEAVGTHSQLMTTNQAYQNMISKGVIE